MRNVFVTIFLLIGLQLHAQNLVVQQEGGRSYLNHTVAAKENWYSIGRIYNISPRDIAPFNNTTIDKGLALGQKLKIPLTDVNMAQSGQPAPDEVFVPLYHVVKEKEGLYRIGQNYNKVSVDQIKAWNKLRTDAATVGSNLIVGFLRVKKDLSPLASGGLNRVAAPVASTQAVPESSNTVPSAKTAATPPGTTVTTVLPRQEPPAAKKETAPPPVTTAPAAKQEPVAANKEATPPVTKTETSTPVSNTPPPARTTPAASTAEGAFGKLYDDQVHGNPSNTVSGQAAPFKSTSGWKDGKYYVLMNKVTPGTIVKITSPATNRSVYAKVLGEIPTGKENEGLLVRLSNAALAQLAVPDGRFEVQLSY